MKNNIIIIVVALFLVSCGSSAPLVGVQGTNIPKKVDINSNQVTLALPDIKKMKSVESTMKFLASDELQGRDTGSEGIEMAAQFIEARFKDAGVAPFYESYRDDFKANEKNAFNIVGVIEGTDPELMNEVIVIGAHYDHIGTAKAVGEDVIANGANDNAAGTTTVLALADHFAQTKNNKRTLVFALFSAEEKGLLGSKHLAARMKKDKVTPYLMFNIEMVGVPMVGKDHFVYASGYEISNLPEVFNGYVGQNIIGFLPKAKEFNLFKRSDNYPFFLEFNIPAHTISSFDFTNFDHYHGVGDESDKINFKFMEGLVKRVATGLEKMANSTKKDVRLIVQ